MNRYQDDNLIGVLKVLYHWRKQILIVVAAATLGSAIISLLLPVYYQATTTFYPVNPRLKSPIYLYGNSAEVVSPFGTEDDLDRMLSISQSKELTDFIIQKFNLYQHYKIDSTQQKAPYKIRKKLLKLYQSQKNEYAEIEILVEDKDPEIARDMANAIREKIDEIDQKLVRSNQLKILKNYELEITQKDAYLKMMRDSLSRLRNYYGIFDVEAQGEFMASIPKIEAELAASKTKLVFYQRLGVADSVRVLEGRIRGYDSYLTALSSSETGFNTKTFNEGREKITFLNTFLETYSEQMTIQQELYRQYKSVVEGDIPSIYTNEIATTPVIKSYPIRSLIVLGSAFVAFVFAMMGVLLLERYKNMHWTDITTDAPNDRSEPYEKFWYDSDNPVRTVFEEDEENDASGSSKSKKKK